LSWSIPYLLSSWRAQVAEPGVASPRVVEGFDAIEHGEPGVGPGAPAGAVDELGLERRAEALGHGVVVGVAGQAHALDDAGPAAAQAERDARVLGAPLRVVDEAGGRAIAMSIASRMSPVRRSQPTTARLKTSTTAPRKRKPCQVGR